MFLDLIYQVVFGKSFKKKELKNDMYKIFFTTISIMNGH